MTNAKDMLFKKKTILSKYVHSHVVLGSKTTIWVFVLYAVCEQEMERTSRRRPLGHFEAIC